MDDDEIVYRTSKEVEDAFASLSEAFKRTSVELGGALKPFAKAAAEISRSMTAGMMSFDELSGKVAAMSEERAFVTEKWTPGETRTADYYGSRVRDTSGRLVYGWRGENSTSRMAEYTVTVTGVVAKPGGSAGASLPEAEYEVVAAWGAFGKTLQRQSKQRTTNMTSAINTAAALIREKQKRDYVQVDEFKFDEDTYPEILEPGSGFVEDSDAVIATTLVVPPVDDCDCFRYAEEIAQALWADAVPADVSVAPLLTQPGFGLEIFGSAETLPRWIVRVDSACSGGYAHVRAYPVDSDNRTSPRIVEEMVLASLNSRTGESFDFAFVVAADGGDLWLIDAIRLEGTDLSDVGWLKRQQTLNARADWVLDRTKGFKGRVIRSPKLVTAGLREEYLGEGDLKLFELHAIEAKLGEPGWALPRL